MSADARLLARHLVRAQPYQVAHHLRVGFGSAGELRGGYWTQGLAWGHRATERIELGHRAYLIAVAANLAAILTASRSG